MTRPRLLDLFCCQGGGAKGYQRAGFHVTGVDIEPQPNYCGDEFVQRDAIQVLEFLADNAEPWPGAPGFDAIHASPPCQLFTQMNGAHRARHALGKGKPVVDLLTPTLAIIRRLDLPWVVENVPGARHHMRPTLKLHGGMFGLEVHRPRYFESNVLILAPRMPINHEPIGVYGDRPQVKERTRLNGDMSGKRSVMRIAKSEAEAQRVMGMPWANWHGCREAIPPAYAEYIGRQLLDHLRAVA